MRWVVLLCLLSVTIYVRTYVYLYVTSIESRSLCSTRASLCMINVTKSKEISSLSVFLLCNFSFRRHPSVLRWTGLHPIFRSKSCLHKFATTFLSLLPSSESSHNNNKLMHFHTDMITLFVSRPFWWDNWLQKDKVHDDDLFIHRKNQKRLGSRCLFLTDGSAIGGIFCRERDEYLQEIRRKPCLLSPTFYGSRVGGLG